MIANPKSVGYHIEDKFFKTPITANKYIPIFAFKTSKEGYYHKPCLESGNLKKANTLKNIKDALELAISPTKITIGKRIYFFVKGVMFTETGIPMIVFAMPREKYLNPDTKKFSEIRYREEVNSVDYKDFVLFYSTSFFTNPDLASLNRRFQKEILMSCYEKGIEVRVITSQEIERNTFADVFEIPKANSVSQLEEYMSKVLPTFLYTEEEDSYVFNELEVQTQNEELPIEEEALLFESVNPIEEIPDLFLTESNILDSAHTESGYVNLTVSSEDFPTLPVEVYTTRGSFETGSRLRTDTRPIELIDDEG
jgi:hypothetical protein